MQRIIGDIEVNVTYVDDNSIKIFDEIKMSIVRFQDKVTEGKSKQLNECNCTTLKKQHEDEVDTIFTANPENLVYHGSHITVERKTRLSHSLLYEIKHTYQYIQV